MMIYSIGSVNVAVFGQDATARYLREILVPVRTEDDHIDLEFRFVEQMPSWNDQSFTKIKNRQTATDSYRVQGDLWCYDMRSEGNRLTVSVVAKKRALLSRTVQTVRKSWKYFHTHGRGARLRAVKRCIYNVFMPTLELALLRRDGTLAHCSAVEKNGTAVLFASLGGVGKTSLMSKLVEVGWKSISDDLCVIGADGTVSLLPLPMHIYKYHEIHSQDMVQRMLNSISPWDRLLWSVCGIFKRPDKTVRWISPEQVFGKEQLSRQAPISVVIHMQKCRNSNSFRYQNVKADEVASLMASTILNEISELPRIAITTHSCGGVSFVPNIAEMYTKIRHVYEAAFREASCHAIWVPQRMTPDDIFAFLHEKELFQRVSE